MLRQESTRNVSALHAEIAERVLSDTGSTHSVLWQLWLLGGLDPEQHSTSDAEPSSHHARLTCSGQTRMWRQESTRNVSALHAEIAEMVLSDTGSTHSVLWQLWLLGGLDPEQHSTSDAEPSSHHARLTCSGQTRMWRQESTRNVSALHAEIAEMVLSDNGSTHSVLWQLWLLGGLDPEQHSTSDAEPASHHQDCSVTNSHVETRIHKKCVCFACWNRWKGLVRQWLNPFCLVAAVASGWVRPWTTQHLRRWACFSSPRLQCDKLACWDKNPQEMFLLCMLKSLKWSCQTLAQPILSCGSCGFWVG